MKNEIVSRTSDGMKLRLGWLESFVAAAQHLSYEGAAKDVGIDAPSVKRNVEELERWLHRVLILDGDPLEINDADNVYFLSIAIECLRIFSAHEAMQRDPSLPVFVRKSKISMVRLIDIQSFIKAVELSSFKVAAYEMGFSHDQLRRNISSLEEALGKSLIAGRSIIYPTPEGIRFFDDARSLVTDLLSSRAVIPGNYDPATEPVRSISEILNRQHNRISGIISQLEKRDKPSKIERIEINNGRKVLANIDSFLTDLSGVEKSGEVE